MNVGGWLRWWGAGGASSLVLLLGAEIERATPSEQASGRPLISLLGGDRTGEAPEANRDDASRERRVTSPAAHNPLATFLDRWLAAPRSPSTPGALATLPSAPATAATGPRLPTKPTAQAGHSAKPSGNPYIESMPGRRPEIETTSKAAPGAPNPKALQPAVSSRPASEESRVVAPTLVAPESSARVPDQTYRPPPARDAKYFPQQKRF